MATVINNPGQTSEGGSVGVVVGILLALVIIGALVVFGIPALRRSRPSSADLNVNVTAPNLPTPNPSPNPNPAGGGQ